MQSAEEYLDHIHNPPAGAPYGKAPAGPVTLSTEERHLIGWHMRQVALAQQSVGSYFGYVMREETTNQRVRVLPHQRLLFEFVQRYPFTVVRLPVGFSKSFCMSALTQWLLGKDATTRGAIISAAEAGAKTTLGHVRTYIEESSELRLVFPKLIPSTRDGDPWTQTAITVERPEKMRHPSVIAVGLDSTRIEGSRLDWINVDDILNDQNTGSPEQRKATVRWIDNHAISRVGGSRRARICLTNTPWHPEDATYYYEEEKGWPSLTMDCWGNIWIKNAPDFDSNEIRPAKSNNGDEEGAHRLTAHDRRAFVETSVTQMGEVKVLDERGEEFVIEREKTSEQAAAILEDATKANFEDVDDVVPLWPSKYGRARLREIRARQYNGGGPAWLRAYELRTRSDEDSRVKVEWIEKAKRNAFDRGYEKPVDRWTAGSAFTGVDMSARRRKGSDFCTIFTFAVLPDRRRLILDIDVGRFKGREFIDRIISHHDRFESIVRLETNSFQDYLRQWAIELDVSLRLRAHDTTGKNKGDELFGVESIITELENGAWLIPCDNRRRVAPSIREFVNDLLAYQPGLHTGDVLMAAWIAREQARASGALVRGAGFYGLGHPGGNLGLNLSAR